MEQDFWRLLMTILGGLAVFGVTLYAIMEYTEFHS